MSNTPRPTEGANSTAIETDYTLTLRLSPRAARIFQGLADERGTTQSALVALAVDEFVDRIEAPRIEIDGLPAGINLDAGIDGGGA